MQRSSRLEVGAPAVPGYLSWLVVLTIGSSFYVPIEPAPTDLVFVFLAIATLLQPGFGVLPRMHPTLHIGILLFVIGNIIALGYSQHFGQSAFFLAVTLYLIALWYVVTILIIRYGPPMVVLMGRAFIFAACMAAVIGILLQMGALPGHLITPHGLTGPRTPAAFKDPNVYAPFLVAAFMLVLGDIVANRRFHMLSIALICLYSVGLIGAFSRGAFVNLAVSLFVFIFVHVFILRVARSVKRIAAFLGLAALTAVPATMGFLIALELEDFLHKRLEYQRYDDKRFAVQAQALELFVEQPLGIGPGEAVNLLPQSTHSLYLKVLSENGFIGALGFGIFLLTCMAICFKGVVQQGPYRGTYAVLFALLAGMLVNSLVIDTLHWRHLFLFMAIPIGLAHYERRSVRRPLSAANAS